MKNVMEKLKKDFGSIEFGGEEYVLVQDAYLDGTDAELSRLAVNRMRMAMFHSTK